MILTFYKLVFFLFKLLITSILFIGLRHDAAAGPVAGGPPGGAAAGGRAGHPVRDVRPSELHN